MKKRIIAALLLVILLLLAACSGGGTQTGTTEPTGSGDYTPAIDEKTEGPEESTATEGGETTDAGETGGSDTITADSTNADSQTESGTSESGTDSAESSKSQPEITTDKPEETTVSETDTAQDTEPTRTGKIRVGISGMDDNSGLANYKSAVIKAGCEPVVLPYVTTVSQAKKILNDIDALIMTGGEDLDPKWYGESKNASNLTVNEKRDASDVLILCEAIARDMPVLCICRGMQILNVVCGGTLYQDLGTQLKGSGTHRDPKQLRFWQHAIVCESDSEVFSILGKTATVNSWHHQAVKTAGTNIKITARGLDNVVEAIELTSKTYIIGVQFHPEQMVAQGNLSFLKFFTDLAAHVK